MDVRSGISRSVRPAGPTTRNTMAVDLLLVAALVAAGLVHSPRGVPAAALSIAPAVPLLWRRRAPVAVFCVAWLLAAVQGLVVRPSAADAALLLAYYTVATNEDSRVAILLGLALEAGVIATAVKWHHGSADLLRAVVSLSGLATAAGVLGINIRNRRLTLQGLRDRARQLEHDREREVALARATERGRISREMHDVVAHNVSVIVALCDGASYHLDNAPERVQAALELASRTGRQALAEMRQLLGVLREDPEQPELAPLPGLSDIESLLEPIRDAGVPVSYTLSGNVHSIPPVMQLTIYRIVQEALTNTLKHAGADVSASVELSCEPDAITVAIHDDGRGAGVMNGRDGATANGAEANGATANGATASGGAGLRGMAERAAVFGAALDAGPLPGGGWQVRTSFALDATATLAAP